MLTHLPTSCTADCVFFPNFTSPSPHNKILMSSSLIYFADEFCFSMWLNTSLFALNVPHTLFMSLFYQIERSSPTTLHEGAGRDKRFSSHSFMTLALDGGEWSASRPGRALPPVPIAQETGWAPEPVWTQRLEKKSSVSAGDRTSIARSSSP
jgi:hypothetical protein